MESNNAEHLIGTRLGTCELQRLIGSGGMGMVFLARQLRPAREVAVKILRSGVGSQTAANQEFLARFRREADVIAQLDHINILPIYEYGEQHGLAYLVMPYLTGGSLRDLLSKRAPLSLEEALTYIQQAASALDYAHQHKIIHRDVKPGNMLFHADGRLVLADFGIARILRETGEGTEATLTSTGQFLGSVDYMAPEMVSGQLPDQRTDIYELGVVLFQMLSGHLPFTGSSAFLIAAQHLQDKPPALSTLNPAISPQVDAVVQKALAKNPDERYARAGDLALALRYAIQGPPDRLSSPDLSSHIDGISTGLLSAPTLTLKPEESSLRPNRTSLPGFTPRPTPSGTTNSPEAFTTGTDRRQQSLLQVNATTSGTRGGLSPSQPVTPTGYRAERSRLGGLVIVVVLLLLVGAGAAFFGLQALRNTGPGVSGPTPVLVSSSPTTNSPVAPTSTPQLTPTPLPAQQARDTIQHYYDAINQANYQEAYQLWGTNYQKTHPYDQFAAGYAATQRVDIVFHAITAQADGSQVVNMTIYARDKTSSGTKLTAFEGNYVVGKENGAWKLLDYHFNVAETPTPIS